MTDRACKVLMVLVVIWGACELALTYVDHTSRETFMRECLADKPAYECVAMWRAR
jgi:hypothetical protein